METQVIESSIQQPVPLIHLNTARHEVQLVMAMVDAIAATYHVDGNVDKVLVGEIQSRLGGLEALIEEITVAVELEHVPF